MKKLRGLMPELIKTFSQYCFSLFDRCRHIKVFSVHRYRSCGYLNKLMSLIVKPSDINVFHAVKISQCILICQVGIAENNCKKAIIVENNC